MTVTVTVMCLHPGSSPPDLVRWNLGLVNSYHSCYCIRLDQDLLPGWMSLNSGATETLKLNQMQIVGTQDYLFERREYFRRKGRSIK